MIVSWENVYHCLSSLWPWSISRPWLSILREFSLTGHTLPTCPALAWQRTAQSPLNGNEEESLRPTMDRQWSKNNEWNRWINLFCFQRQSSGVQREPTRCRLCLSRFLSILMRYNLLITLALQVSPLFTVYWNISRYYPCRFVPRPCCPADCPWSPARPICSPWWWVRE